MDPDITPTETQTQPENATRNATASRLFLILLDERRKSRGQRKPLVERWRELKTKRRAEAGEAIRAWVAAGLVRVVTADADGDPDLNVKGAIELTDQGAAHARREFKLQPNAQPTGATVNAIVDDLREELERLRAGGAVAPAPVTEPPADARESILRLFRALEAEEHGLVPIWRIRRALPGVAREPFDRALLDLQRDDLVALVPLNDARDTPDDRLADGIVSPFGGDRLFFVQRGARS